MINRRQYVFLCVCFILPVATRSEQSCFKRTSCDAAEKTTRCCPSSQTHRKQTQVALKSKQMERKVVASSILKTATHFRSGSDGAEIKLLKANKPHQMWNFKSHWNWNTKNPIQWTFSRFAFEFNFYNFQEHLSDVVFQRKKKSIYIFESLHFWLVSFVVD